MQLTSIILCIFVIGKSLSLPSNHYKLESDNNNKMISCYKSNNQLSNFDNITKINEILSNVKNKTLVNNSTRYICGITLDKQPSGNFKIWYNKEPKENCVSNTTICDYYSRCNKLISCCEEGHSCKFQVELISKNSSEYNKTVKDCEVVYPRMTKCLKVSKIEPTEPTEPTNLSIKLFSVFYAHIAIVLAYIQNK